MNKLTMKLFKDDLRKFIKENQNDLILVAGVVLVSLISFGAGRLTAPASMAPEPIIIEENLGASMFLDAEEDASDEAGDSQQNEQGEYVASINGTKYHYPWCSGARNIKEENKIWFKTREEADKAGYTPAANCPGL